MADGGRNAQIVSRAKEARAASKVGSILSLMSNKSEKKNIMAMKLKTKNEVKEASRKYQERNLTDCVIANRMGDS